MTNQRGRGRPSTGTKVQVRIPPEVLTRIDKLAAMNKVTRAEMMRRLLIDAT